MNEFLELKNIQGISENEIQPYFRVGNLLQKKRVLNISMHSLRIEAVL